MLRVGIVAGEPSGDRLGAGLLRALRARRPGLRAEGIAGPEMQAAGCRSLYPMERLSVMGLVETAGRLGELIGQRRRLLGHFRAHPPDVFVGVDAPDYNLALERGLRRGGVPTVHYVSPSVWAWRAYRLHGIARGTDLMLTLFPFETSIYRRHGIPVRYVGHPLAAELPLETDRRAARRALGLDEEREVVALLPGSRTSELRYLGRAMLGAARWLLGRRPGLRFVVPAASAATLKALRAMLARAGELPVTLVEGRGLAAMAAADVVLLASGTAALEAMLLKRPTVVAYRVSPLSAPLLRRMLRVEHVALPNLLAGRRLFPELLQEDATPEALGAAVLRYLEDPELCEAARAESLRLHEALREDSDQRAAEAVLSLLDARQGRVA